MRMSLLAASAAVLLVATPGLAAAGTTGNPTSTQTTTSGGTMSGGSSTSGGTMSGGSMSGGSSMSGGTMSGGASAGGGMSHSAHRTTMHHKRRPVHHVAPTLHPVGDSGTGTVHP
jgi:uncharacterized membrane protein